MARISKAAKEQAKAQSERGVWPAGPVPEEVRVRVWEDGKITKSVTYKDGKRVRSTGGLL